LSVGVSWPPAKKTTAFGEIRCFGAEEGTLSGSFLASLAETYGYLPFYISSIILKYGCYLRLYPYGMVRLLSLVGRGALDCCSANKLAPFLRRNGMNLDVLRAPTSIFGRTASNNSFAAA